METSCIANSSKLHSLHNSSNHASKPRNIVCNSLDDFFILVDKMGRLQGSQRKSNKIKVKTMRPSTLEDARAIVNIYETVYEGQYPYAEMLDEQWIFASFSDPSYFWGVFRIVEDIPEIGTIIGSFTMVSDFYTKTAYFRGLNILPAYQKKVGVRELSFALGEKFFSAMKGKIDKFYAECLAVHPISQLISRGGGSHCEAMFLNKDYCKGQKASVAMMVGYFDRALFEYREKPKYLLPEIIPFHARTCKIHKLDDYVESIDNPDFEVDIQEVYRVTKNAKIVIKVKEHNYYDLEFTDEHSGSFLKALYTPAVKNIEKITYQSSDDSILMGLFMLLKNFAKSKNVEYIEWQVRASDYNLADFLLIHDFQVQGYVPAWIPAINSEKFEDVIIMGWTHKIPNYDSIKTYDEGFSLLNLILSNHYPRCELDMALFNIIQCPAN
ncbi:MAG: hypothetical protein ACTSYI_01430 [Promethearchaeota archaeon]